MFGARLRPEPLSSFRHAMEGRIGELGRLPAGWAGEYTAKVEVLAVNSSQEKPSLTVKFEFDSDTEEDFFGLSVGQFLPAPKDSVVALAAEVTLIEWDNVVAAFMILREWRQGGQFMGQSNRPLSLSPASQIGLVAHLVGGKGRVIQPFLLVRRRSAAPGGVTVTLRGVAFGNLYDHPRWLWN